MDCLFDLSACDGCGDGVTDGTEECDDGPANSDTDPDACRTDCRLPRCGDGVTDTAESCDGLAPGGATCQGAGYDGGTVWCWGDNYSGQLGDGTTTDQPLPVQVVGLTDVASISLGHGLTCAVDTSNQGWCWGQNFMGELGNGTQTDSLTPVAVQGL